MVHQQQETTTYPGAAASASTSSASVGGGAAPAHIAVKKCNKSCCRPTTVRTTTTYGAVLPGGGGGAGASGVTALLGVAALDSMGVAALERKAETRREEDRRSSITVRHKMISSKSPVYSNRNRVFLEYLQKPSSSERDVERYGKSRFGVK